MNYKIRSITVLIFAFFFISFNNVFAASARPLKNTSGMALSTQAIANEIGIQVLEGGGNAIDAAVAVGYALAVVHPVAGNIGGGGFAVIHLADGTNISLDFREKAPLKASRDMYLDKNGNVIPELNRLGYLAAAVPGSVAGYSEMLKKYGTRTLTELILPAIKYADEGFPVTERQMETFKDHKNRFAQFKSSRKYFLKPDGSTYREGEKLIQKDLARTLRLIAQKGPDAFYKGEIADLIAADMAKNGGIITKKDLALYSPVWRDCVQGTYRGYEIISMAPPSSGGSHIIQMLNILEGYDIKAMGPGSSQYIHVLAESMRRAYADRSEYMGDPDFVKVPISNIISKEYAAKLRQTIEPTKATPSIEIKAGKFDTNEGTQTTHFSVADKYGNAVSVTTTLNDYYGCAASINGAGFLLNNEMDDFSAKPGSPNMYGLIGGEANAIAPGKRPLSSMSPTIVLKEGKLYMIVGSPGGARIITTVLQVIINVLDFKMDIREAVDEPRVHMQWYPDELRIEKYGLSNDVINTLKAMGYNITVKDPMGDVNAILIKNNVFYGAGDPRNEF